MKSLRQLIEEGETVTTSCPVCGRQVMLKLDGTLWNHFTSFFNQDDPSQPLCVGGEMKVVEDDRMSDPKHEV